MSAVMQNLEEGTDLGEESRNEVCMSVSVDLEKSTAHGQNTREDQLDS